MKRSFRVLLLTVEHAQFAHERIYNLDATDAVFDVQ